MSKANRFYSSPFQHRLDLLLLLSIVILIGGLALSPGCGPSSDGDGPDSTQAAAESQGEGDADSAEADTLKREEKEIKVDAGQVRQGDLVIPIYADGALRTTRSLEVKTKVGGELVEVAVREGDRVRKGQLLARLDPREYELALQDSRYRYIQALSQLKAELGTIEPDNGGLIEFAGRREELEKQKRKGELTQEEFQARLLELELRSLEEGTFRQQVLEQRTGLAEARSAEERARLDLEYTEILAPFSGVVEKADVVPGEIVGVGSIICTLYNNDRLEAAVNVLEADLGNLELGRPALLAVPATRDTLRGKVDVISPRLDESSRTCEVLIRFENPTGRYRPGMFVRAEIAGWVYRDRMMVPKAAVLTRDDRPLVFKVNGDRAEWLYVTTGLENDSWVEITAVHSGGSLEPGDKVVVSDHLTLAHEAKIDVRRTRPPVDRWDLAGVEAGAAR